MIERAACQRKDTICKGSQMTVDRKVVVPKTRKQLISRLHGTVTSQQWTGRRRVLARDRTWQQGDEYGQTRVVSLFCLRASCGALGEQMGEQKCVQLLMRFKLVELSRREERVEILAVLLVSTPMQRLTLG